MSTLNYHILRCRFAEITSWHNKLSRPFWRLYWNPTPGALIRHGEEEVRLERGQLLGIPPSLIVEQVLEQPFEQLWMHLEIPSLQQLPHARLQVLQIGEDVCLRLQQLVTSVQKTPNKPTPLLAEFWVSYFFSGLEQEMFDSSPKDWRMQRALQLLQENLSPGISLQRMAEEVKLSSKQLQRNFKRQFACSPKHMQLRLRGREAAKLLVTSDLSLEQIAEHCGYCDRHHFTRSFQQQYLQTPASFRRDHES